MPPFSHRAIPDRGPDACRSLRVWARAECVNYRDYIHREGCVDLTGGTGDIQDIQLVGDLAYVADDALLVVDVSDPTSPEIVASPDTPGSSANSVVVQGTYAHVTDGAFQVIDISVPESPWLVGSAAVRTATDLAVSGSSAYVIGRFSGLVVVDISDPALPTIITTLAMRAFMTYGVAVPSGTYWIRAATPAGVQIQRVMITR